jgi:hypothetical protein
VVNTLLGAIADPPPRVRGGVAAIKAAAEAEAKKISAETQKSLECLRCTERYSKKDILEGRYWLETLICSKCYMNMQRAPHSVSCFGKPSVMISDVKKIQGFDLEMIECRELCPDRKICEKIMLSIPDVRSIQNV